MRWGFAAAILFICAACVETPAPPPFIAVPWERSEDSPVADRHRNYWYSSFAMRRLIAEAHQAGDSATVRARLRALAEIGYVPSEGTLTELAPHIPDAEMARLRVLFEESRTVVQASRVVDLVPAEYRLVEGIAWDERGDRLFAGTVVSRALLVREPAGWRAIEGLDAGSLFGLAIDRPRNLLWMASGRVEQTPSPETAFRGLIALDLQSLRPVRWLALPGEGSPADIAVGRDGSVYASDPVSGAVYRAAPGAAALSVLVPSGLLHNPQGLALSPDGHRLYVSDYVQGLAIVNLADGRLGQVLPRVQTMLDGFDGLHPFGPGLIAVQNGTSPRRILYLGTGDDWVHFFRFLESNHPEWGEPTLGTVRGREFLYVADAQWERYGPGGVLRDGGPPRATAIRMLRPFD